MKLAYYPIRGRGEGGSKFQLARLQDENGNGYKGEYDQARHFGSEAELKTYLASVVNVSEDQLQLSTMSL
jgi:hypothetical protein